MMMSLGVLLASSVHFNVHIALILIRIVSCAALQLNQKASVNRERRPVAGMLPWRTIHEARADLSNRRTEGRDFVGSLAFCEASCGWLWRACELDRRGCTRGPGVSPIDCARAFAHINVKLDTRRAPRDIQKHRFLCPSNADFGHCSFTTYMEVSITTSQFSPSRHRCLLKVAGSDHKSCIYNCWRTPDSRFLRLRRLLSLVSPFRFVVRLRVIELELHGEGCEKDMGTSPASSKGLKDVEKKKGSSTAESAY
jgi:hypothetical protein